MVSHECGLATALRVTESRKYLREDSLLVTYLTLWSICGASSCDFVCERERVEVSEKEVGQLTTLLKKVLQVLNCSPVDVQNEVLRTNPSLMCPKDVLELGSGHFHHVFEMIR